MRDIRRTLGLLASSTSLALSAVLVFAAPAEARNIGGTQISDAACVTPGGTQYGRSGADLPCVCAIADGGVVVRVVGRGPSACPTGIPAP